MTTSGQTVIDETAIGIINSAARKLGAISLGQSLSSLEITNALEALNNLVAEYQTLGMPLWSRLTYNVPWTVGTTSYTFGIGQTINIPFPLKILQAWTQPVSGGSIQELWPNSIDVFNRLPKNVNTGTPSQYVYQPFIDQGVLQIWTTPDATTIANRLLYISYQSPFQGFVNNTDNPYFPREWNNALIYGLADLLAPEYGMSLSDQSSFKKSKMEHVELALDFGLENASLTFQPQENWNHGQRY